MAAAEERAKRLGDVKARLEELAAIDPASLGRRAELSPAINFEDAVPYFEQMLDIVKELNQRDLARLSTQHLGAIERACNTVEDLVSKVKSFVLNQNTPGDVCKSIIEAVRNAYDSVMEPMTVPLAFTASQSTDYARIEREAKGYHATMRAEAEEFRKSIETAKEEAEAALAAIKKQAAEAGVSQNAQFFRENSSKHGQAARSWIKSTIALAAVTLVAALLSFIWSLHYTPESTPAAIQYFGGKLIVLSVLSFGIFWSSRNYKAHKHNETLNTHRADALLTFRTFVEGTSDPRVKDAILLQAAQAAFGSRPTGFDSAEPETTSIHPVVDVLGRILKQPSQGSGN